MGTSQTVRQGVVLAAGHGRRMRPLSDVIPKPLAPICNKPIMQYQLEAMSSAGIRDIAVVVGPNGAPIRSYFEDGRRLGLRLHYLEDDRPRGIASSLAVAETWVRGPFMVFLGDIMFALDDLTPALAPLDEGAAAVLVVRRDSPDAIRRSFAVILDEDGRVTRVIEKPPNPPTNLKGCGAYVFDSTIFEAIRRTPRSPLRNEYELTDAIQILIGMGHPVVVAHVARWDVNVTVPSDLIDCTRRMLQEQCPDRLIGAAARVSEECLPLGGAHVRQLSGWSERPVSDDAFIGLPADIPIEAG